MCNILFIEDEAVEAQLIIERLELLNFNRKRDNFIICENMETFEEKIKTQKIDIVLCDYNLGTFTGKDIINYLQQKNIEVPVIIVTGAIGEECAAELMKMGAADLVLKNNIEKLDQVIDRELKSFFYKIDQLKIMEKINLILYRLAKTVNWIMQHDLDKISFKKILHSFATILEIDRAYIFEKKDDGHYYLLHLWCGNKECKNANICNTYDPKCVNFSHTPDSLIISFIDKNKPFYGSINEFDEKYKDELIKNNIKSLAAIPIYDPNKKIWGFLGFDDCNKEKMWTDLEINTLTMLGAILGTIVYKISLKKQEDELITEQVNLLKTARESIIGIMDSKGEKRYGHGEQ